VQVCSLEVEYEDHQISGVGCYQMAISHGFVPAILQSLFVAIVMQTNRPKLKMRQRNT